MPGENNWNLSLKKRGRICTAHVVCCSVPKSRPFGLLRSEVNECGFGKYDAILAMAVGDIE
jgi:hypothetical protein